MSVARLVLPALRWSRETGFAHEEPAIAAALALGVGGFIVFGGTVESVRALTADLEQRAGRPLLVGSDLERGAGQQIAGLTELPPPRALASLGDVEAARWAGAVTAHDARSVGINWVFAPVADLDVLESNPIVQTRSFGAEPAEVAGFVRAWIEGCQAAGALACAKHYPGHGRTVVDSHAELPVVAADAATLEATDLVPFDAAIGAGVAALMSAHVAYPALDPAGRPATFSPAILGALRSDRRFDGLVVTDALIMEGARAGRGEDQAAVDAVAAGADILLYPNDPAASVRGLEAARGGAALPESRVAEALARYEHALRAAHVKLPAAPTGPYAGADALADALVARGMLRGTVARLDAPLELRVVDDDIGGPYVASPSDFVERALADAGVPLASADAAGAVGRTRIVLAFAEPRAWKGRAGFGPATREALARLAPGAALVALFGHPRLVNEIPGEAPVLVAWHRQRLMQEAVARWVAGRARET